MRFLTVGLMAAASLVLSVEVASAALIQGTYSVTGSGFASLAVPPYTSITESFTISFDNTKAVSQQTAGISLNASTITPGSPLAFTYVPATDTLFVGGTDATVTSSALTSADFALVLSNASSVSAFNPTALSYSVGQNAVYSATVIGQTMTMVPEPVSLALLGSAIAAVGVVRRQRRG